MNIFKEMNLFLAARATCKQKRFYNVAFDPSLKIAPYVVSTLISYNQDVAVLLNKKKYPTYRVTRSGRARKYSATLTVGMLNTRETVDRLQSEIQKKDMLMTKERERLQERRIDGQKYRKPHLVQQCNNTEDQLMLNYASEVLELANTIRKVISAQLLSLTKAENLIAARLGACVDQNHRFYTSLPEFGFREQLRLPTIHELQQIVPLQEFPKEYRVYRDNMQRLYDEYEKITKELRKQLGI